MIRVKFVLMGRFVVFVGCIVCGGQGRDIVSFLEETLMEGNMYVH